MKRKLVSCGLNTSTKDYHAKLVIHGLSNMDKKQRVRLYNWLKSLTFEFNPLFDHKKYAKVYTIKLMK